MTLSLVQDGDRAEQLFGHYITQRFPAYQQFWAEFIVPLTGRPASIRLRPGLDPLLARMVETHYSLFSHLVAAHRLLDLATTAPIDAEALYDAVFLFMSAATEMAEDFLVVWARIRADVEELGILPGFEPISPEKAAEDLVAYLGGRRYDADREKFLAGGAAVRRNLHTEEQIIGPLLKAAGARALDAWSSFTQSMNRVRHYRNSIAHHPALGKWVTPKGAVLYPREERLQELDAWQRVEECDDVSKFDYPARLAADFLIDIEQGLDSVWRELTLLCRSLAASPHYKSMIPQALEAKPGTEWTTDSTGYHEVSISGNEGPTAAEGSPAVWKKRLQLHGDQESENEFPG